MVAPMYDVAIVPCKDYNETKIRKALLEAISLTGGLNWVVPGMKIAIKTNLVAPMKAESAAITHPAIVWETAKILAEHGAHVVIGDCPGTPFVSSNLKYAYSASGLDTFSAENSSLNYCFSKSTVFYNEAKVAKSFDCADFLLNADAIVDICKLKTHGLMKLSCATKNFFGAVPGLEKTEYHYRFPEITSFSDMLIDITSYLKPRLCICDAVVGMEGNGPTAGTPRSIGVLLASVSPHKLDYVAASLIGLDPMSVPTIVSAINRGLLPQDFNRISVSDNLNNYKVSDYILVEENNSFIFNPKSKNPFTRTVSKLAEKLMKCRPNADSTCIGCGKCAERCPADAIQIVNKHAQINRNKCIRCFCCQEFCPVGSMKVYRSLCARIVTGKSHRKIQG